MTCAKASFSPPNPAENEVPVPIQRKACAQIAPPPPLWSHSHLADVAHERRGGALILQACELHHVRGVIRTHRLLARLLAERDAAVLGQRARGVRLLGAQLAQVRAAHRAVEHRLPLLLASLVTRDGQLQQQPVVFLLHTRPESSTTINKNRLMTSVPDLRHFGVDPDPGIHASD